MIKLAKKAVVLVCFVLPVLANAQALIKQSLKADGEKYRYYETQPSATVKGLLILLPGAGENPKSIFTKTKLAAAMADVGYVTIAPEIPTEMFASEACVRELNALIKDKLSQYSLAYSNVVVGGLSNGGAMALGYAEYLNSQTTPQKLKAVFAIDPPTDLSRIYASAKNELSYQCPLINQEGTRLQAYLDRTLGGAPSANAAKYYQASVFTAASNDGGNARFLKDLPLRLYSEPDLAFVQKTYCAELQFFNLNAYDLERLAKFMKDAGNTRAQYITTQGKGFHSWNIVDAAELVKWVESL